MAYVAGPERETGVKLGIVVFTYKGKEGRKQARQRMQCCSQDMNANGRKLWW